MTEGYARVAQLLVLTYTSADDTIRKSSEQELSELCKDYKPMIQILLHICSDNENLQLRISAATKLRHLLRSVIEASALTPQEKCDLGENIFKIMILNQEKNLRSILSYGICTLLSEDSFGIMSIKLSSLCMHFLNGSLPEIQASLMCIKGLFSNISNDFSTKEFFIKLLPILTNLGISTYKDFLASYSSQDSDNLYKSLLTLSSWSETFTQILEHFEMISPKTIREFLKKTEIADLFSSIISFKLQDNRITVIDYSSNIIKEMNLLKTNILEAINILLQYIIDSKKKLLEEQEKIAVITTLVGMDLPDTAFVNYISIIIEPLIINLLQLSNEHDLSAIEDENYTNFIIESLELFSKCAAESRFFPIFSLYHKHLLLKIIPNALHLTENDKEKVITSPSEFVSLGMDICERQESENIQSTGAKLLEIICDNIDGALSLIVNTAVSVIQNALNGNSTIFNEELAYLNSFDQEVKFDTCIIMLCTVSYSVSRRKDLISLLDSLFLQSFTALIQANSAIIQSRLCMFIYFYIESMNVENDEQLLNWIWYLIECMNPVSNCKAGMIQACETFSSVCSDEEVMLRLHLYLENVFTKIISCIPGQRERNFFEALLELINWYSDISHTQIMDLVNILVQKIQYEHLNTGNNQNCNILIQKC